MKYYLALKKMKLKNLQENYVVTQSQKERKNKCSIYKQNLVNNIYANIYVHMDTV